MSKPADNGKLGTVHDKFATWAVQRLEAEPDPETGTGAMTAAEASVIRAFLKDNNITAVPSEDNALGELERKLKERRAKRAARATMPDLDSLLADGPRQ